MGQRHMQSSSQALFVIQMYRYRSVHLLLIPPLFPQQFPTGLLFFPILFKKELTSRVYMNIQFLVCFFF